METTTGKRIQMLRKAKKLSVQALADMLDIKASAVYGLESDANKPSYDTITALTSNFPDLSPDWLLTGNGDMLRDGKNLTPQERPTDAPTRTSQVPYAGPQLVAESDYIKEIKESRDRAIDEAETWKELYLSQIGKSELLGKLPGSLDAAPHTELIHTYSRRRAGFTPTFLQLQEMEAMSSRHGLMWVVQEVGYATELEEQEAA